MALDRDGIGDLQRRVDGAGRAIAPGQVRTCGEPARTAGAPGAARAVGHALGRNPFAALVPCHRILAARGRAELRLLPIEGASAGPLGPGLSD